MEVEIEHKDGDSSDKANEEHMITEYDVEEEDIEPGVEEGEGGDVEEDEVAQKEIVLGRGEDANAAETGEWG